jgi:hypothetical protein
MPEVVGDAADLPIGAHAVSLHVNHEEAAEHAAAFLAGTPEGQAARYWVPEASLAHYYSDKLARRAPEQVGCVQIITHEQVAPVDGRLRPTPEIRAFADAHPEGISAGADTISLYWTAETIPEHLEYEAWFDEEVPRASSRFVCPYDLRRVPPEVAPEVLRELGAHHSHCVLSDSQEPAVRLLQLFLFGRREAVPASLAPTLAWAERAGLLEVGGAGELDLTDEGDRIVHRWCQVASANQ